MLNAVRKIYNEAIERFNPNAIVAMVSGGNDSAAAYHVAKEIGARIDFVMHINTHTGIPETTEFVRDYYGAESPIFIEADAGTAYEDYVLRKGFFGRGYTPAHEHAYHVLKAGPLRSALSKHIRQRRRNVRILLLNGARALESANRKVNLPDIYNHDPSQKNNIWVNLIHGWSKDERDQYLESRKVCINPVTRALCRSGECMCGTMQSLGDRVEASLLYPHWGKWLDELEAEVIKRFPWGWGMNSPRWYNPNQLEMFQPMCIDCKRNPQEAP